MNKKLKKKSEKLCLEQIYHASDPVAWKERRENRIDILSILMKRDNTTSNLDDSFERKTISAFLDESDNDYLGTPEGGVIIAGKEYIPKDPKDSLVRKVLMDKTYYGGEHLIDAERDVSELIADAEDIPTEDGILQGSFRVTIIWTKDY